MKALSGQTHDVRLVAIWFRMAVSRKDGRFMSAVLWQV